MDQTKKARINSGENLSYWVDSFPQLSFETLKNDIDTDVLIIGAGIAGLTTAANINLKIIEVRAVAENP